MRLVVSIFTLEEGMYFDYPTQEVIYHDEYSQGVP